jgi:hypothetical protein
MDNLAVSYRQQSGFTLPEKISGAPTRPLLSNKPFPKPNESGRIRERRRGTEKNERRKTERNKLTRSKRSNSLRATFLCSLNR